MIRKIAVHRVWDALSKKKYAMQVVEIDSETHLVKRIYPLTEEIGNTEWWGGLMIISPTEPSLPEPEERLDSYFGRIGVSGRRSQVKMHAFHITGLNITDRRFAPVSRIARV